ncbi:uncharacterized protein LOC127450884 isoform X2 [Myxocyprinus asiaticus]|uniref:uncharacterized protein LOC127450884 isoform X2 n=1 Tax=Myxocyprinus asiaticus TaxID=70543 RepID=UPI0022239C2B|nr:uncharacterized protein LOC127450884 isoform X2 [Myxocyprinus asiaticus]
MTKLQLLHRALNERLMAAVEQIMEMVGCTVLEYEEETVRVRKENEVLRRRLRWMEGANPADWQGPSEPVMLTTLDKSNPSQQEESTVSFRFELESEELVIKTETIDHPLNARPDSSHATLPQSTDQGSAIAGTSAGINYSLTDGMTWDSNQSYMAPLDFDPTSNSRVSSWREGSRRQRMSFACPDCGKVFGSKQRLMFHMRIHSTERPYAYRRRKACFYGDKNKRKNKLHGLSQLSRKIGDDLSDGSEQTNGSSALAERLAITGPEQDQDSPTTESDTSSDKDPENSTANPVHLVHQQKAKKRMPCCPHCSRVFIRPGRLAAHIKRHLMEARRHSVNLPNTYSARNEMVDEKRKLPKKQRIVNNDAVVKDRAKRLKKNMPVQNKLSKGKTKEADPKNSGSTKVHSTKRVKVQMKIFPCPHCDKVFAREGWLGPHIQMRHFKENSISYFDSLPGSGLRRSRRPFTKVFYKGTPDAEGISKESKQENKANLIVIVPKVNINEAVQSADGHKIVTESKRAPEEPEESKKDASDFDRETSGTESLMNTFPCELCDKTFMMKWRLKKHKRTHIAQNLLLHKRRKRMLMDEESLMETKLKQQKQESREAKKPSEEEEKLNDKGSTSNTQPKKSQSMEDAEMMVKNKPGCCVCKYCGKIYTRINWLKKHMLGHRKEKLVARNEQSETDKMQSNEGNTNKPSSKTRGQGSFPCPFCDKVFTREMRLLMHMQIHSGEKPYSYRQRKAQFYGDIRCRLPRNHNHEVSTIPPLRGNRDVSEESAGEETINEDKSAHLSISATDPVSQDLCQPQSALQACTGSLNILPQTVTGQPNQRTESELVSDVISHINLQPRIVLEPIMTECKYLSTVSGVGDVKTDSSERSGFDLEQTSCPALIDDEMGDVMNDHIVGYKPGVGYSGISETDIVCVEVGSLQQVSQTEVELNNTVVPQATEFSVGNNTKGQQKVVSENQIPVIVIDDEPEQSATQTSTFASSLESASSEPITAAKNAPTGCGKTNWDREEISAMKLTVMEPTPFLESVFKETTSGAMQKNIDSELFVVLSDSEDDVDDDMLGPSKGLDKKKIASVASISKEQLDASRTVIPESVIKAPNNDSQIPAPDAMESITEDPTTIDSASQQTDSDADTDVEFVPNERNDQSISNDLLIKDQMASAGIKQTEDSSMTQKKEMKISGLIFAGQESLSQHLQGHTDKKLLDMKIVFGDERKNKKHGVNQQSFTDNDALSTSSFEKAPEGPECQTNSSDEKSRLFKTHYCIYCKKPRYRMIAHLQSAHPSEPEVAKALSFDKSSKERRQLLSLLQTKGNVLHNTDVVKNSTRDVKPFARFAVSSSFDDRVNCIYCLGLFSKKSFDTHLEQCQGKCPQNAETSGNEMPHTTEIKAEHESTNCSNEEVSLSQCNVDQERSITPTSEISSITAYPNRDCIPRSPGNDFSPPQNAQTVSDDLSKSSVKAQTHETWRRGRKRKRRSCHQNQTLFMEDDLLGEGESSTPNSKVYACQHCGATFCSPYKLRRHEYTHTGCTPSCTDQVKLKRSKRGVHSEETSVKDEARKELTQPHKESPEDLLNTVNESTGEEAASTYQDTEESEFHWEEAGHSRQDTC